ncbi:MAG: DUF420 domain-containing protein [Gemmatimonadota bacterium]
MIGLHDLPLINAGLNATTAILLVAGFWYIRRGRVASHRRCMLGAVSVSAVFLSSYLVYHAQVGSIRFTAGGWPRLVYFTVLLTHTVLAVTVVPLALVTAALGLRGRLDRHVRIARWTLPIWLYVSVTGVVVYLMLYRWFPSAEL